MKNIIWYIKYTEIMRDNPKMLYGSWLFKTYKIGDNNTPIYLSYINGKYVNL
jgi:hypothetical protein